MNTIVIIPTRDRPDILFRSIRNFGASNRIANIKIESIVVSNDTSTKSGVLHVSEVVKMIGIEYPELKVHHLEPPILNRGRNYVMNNPGVARNRAFSFIKQNCIPHDSVLLLDDDISLTDCMYQFELHASDGQDLLCDIKKKAIADTRIIGCLYNGRQDLSLLENLSLICKMKCPKPELLANCIRSGIPDSAPGRISGAFLFINAPVYELPNFLPWYNEDYFWLRRMQLQGWKLECSARRLVHAPQVGLEISKQKLMFEQYGETLWDASSIISRNATFSELSKILKNCIGRTINDLLALEKKAKILIHQNNTVKEMLRSISSTLFYFKKIQKELNSYNFGNYAPPEMLQNLVQIAEYYDL